MMYGVVFKNEEIEEQRNESNQVLTFLGLHPLPSSMSRPVTGHGVLKEEKHLPSNLMRISVQKVAATLCATIPENLHPNKKLVIREMKQTRNKYKVNFHNKG